MAARCAKLVADQHSAGLMLLPACLHAAATAAAARDAVPASESHRAGATRAWSQRSHAGQS